ncbi:hypothetical protein CLF_110346 [Clonorchis sinensis]|uniref:Uncharacterized protein n=1 Tax=Clonorchis sinensis TaxID=79923 RepID=G7YKK0_CLOSI|nr:hypothetical protein CLF_110346 [Clonorchis sinensis]
MGELSLSTGFFERPLPRSLTSKLFFLHTLIRLLAVFALLLRFGYPIFPLPLHYPILLKFVINCQEWLSCWTPVRISLEDKCVSWVVAGAYFGRFSADWFPVVLSEKRYRSIYIHPLLASPKPTTNSKICGDYADGELHCRKNPSRNWSLSLTSQEFSGYGCNCIRLAYIFGTKRSRLRMPKQYNSICQIRQVSPAQDCPGDQAGKLLVTYRHIALWLDVTANENLASSTWTQPVLNAFLLTRLDKGNRSENVQLPLLPTGQSSSALTTTENPGLENTQLSSLPTSLSNEILDNLSVHQLKSDSPPVDRTVKHKEVSGHAVIYRHMNKDPVDEENHNHCCVDQYAKNYEEENSEEADKLFE